MVIPTTNLKEFKLFRRGKVRDVYEVDDKLLIVATDRISAFDVIMPNPVPQKGEILTQISLYWFGQTKDIVPNHLITSDVEQYPSVCKPYSQILSQRSMLVHKTNPLPVECIVRGYISGSGWKEYQKNSTICGIPLGKGLMESEKLSEPIFTPSTKAESGHDHNISFEKIKHLIGQETAEKVREMALKIYVRAQSIAEKKGIIIADTKMEFGIKDGEIILIDELLTPDSSRFWPAALYKPGGSQPSFDKQFLRDYLIAIRWDNNSPAPQLPDEIIIKTKEKYTEALRLLTQ
ncbi:phosphoribosylaminoimidazolesuccinocarboxamide synthase [bacterium]|nr:phosphoribosylaminoimidazolesuccinocarboxamide synthase [bacterium]